MSKRNLLLPINLLLIAALACSLPGLEAPPSTEEGVAETEVVISPTPLPPLPPTLVESFPPPGVEFAPRGALTLFFDQAMDTPSVKTAFKVDPPVETYLDWLDDRTLRVQPSEPLQYATDYLISVGTEARSMAGLALTEPILIDIHTVENLQVTQVLPEPETVGVNPGSPITVVFSRPVVPLELEGDFPLPLSLEPTVSGEGEWIDTSIFLFRPDPQLPGGITYSARIEAGLTDLTGGILAEPYSWTFTTASPEVESLTPMPFDQGVARDSSITLVFNQMMDTASVEQAFTLTGPDQARIPGTNEWNDGQTRFIFTPSDLLDYNVSYDVRLAPSARSAGGSSLTSTFQASFTTVPRAAIIGSSPREDLVKATYAAVEIQFNAPMDQASLLTSLQISPQIENLGTYWRSEENTLVVYGDYQPSIAYQLSINQAAVDPYGTPLTGPFILNFSTSQLPPSARFTRYSSVLTLTTDGPQQIEVSHRNTYRLDLELYRLTMDQFFELIQSGLYRAVPRGELLRRWPVNVTGEANKTNWETVQLYNTPLPSGTYLLSLDIPNDDQEPQLQLVLIRRVELVIKSTTETNFIWVVDLTNGQPLPDHSVRLLNNVGGEIGRGVTDSNGMLTLYNPMGDDPYTPFFVISGSPGEDLFGLTGNFWSDGIMPYYYGLWLFDTLQPDYETYLYTDRPIYRPGQTVHFRGVHRQTSEARYLLPDMTSVNVTMRDERNEIVYTQTASLSEFGTFHGEHTLSEAADLGSYSIETEYGSVFFDVAAYRKPEFTVTVEPSASQVASGDPLTATISAEYFFGGPVADAEVQWVAWFDPFYPPALARATDWFDLALGPQYFTSFESSAHGDGVTGSDGELLITLPTTLEKGRPAQMTIEATITDSSGFPVSGRTTVDVHPATVYLTLSPDRYALRVGETAIINLHSVDWAGNPVPGQETDIRVERLTWRQVVDDEGQIGWESDATLVNQVSRPTGEDGSFLFSFLPEKGGTYRVSATGVDPAGRQTKGQLTIWVSGQGVGLWRQPPAGRMALVPDRESYQPGDVARILVPSPFQEASTALVTIERGEVLFHQVTQIEGADSILEVPIKDIYAPNVYLSVVLIRPMIDDGLASLAVGMIELPVAADALALQVKLTPDRTRAGPGEDITYQLEALDAQGQPVQAEFSFALADLAVLSLTEPNSPSPFEAFYSRQPLRVRTGISLAKSGEGVREGAPTDGIGGGGGEMGIYEVRREFPDTAYWNASVVTDSLGQAQVSLTLPDSLTTWRMDTRGVTLDTLVGSTTVDLVTIKDLLIRPVTPRFFTAGDAASVAAVVHNNTLNDLTVESQLLASGAEITSSPSHTATVPAQGQMRFEWSVTIQDVDTVDLTFHVAGGGLQDASKPTVGSAEGGALPVLRYSAPDTVATAGIIETAGERVEAISLPRRYDATQGELTATLDPSLGSAMNTALDVLEYPVYYSTEAIVSSFLPNLAAYRALQELSLDDPTLQGRLRRTLDDGLQALRSHQASDGGWGWWIESPSNPYLTAYVLYSLAIAREAGVEVNEQMVDSAVQYLLAGIVSPTMLKDPTVKNRQAFVLYALAIAGQGDLTTTRQMAAERGELDLWARALLAQTLGLLSPGDALIPPLLSDFEAAAVRSATGVHWEDETIDCRNMGSSVRTTAHVLQTLIALDGDNPLITGAVRWLIAGRARDGAWSSTHETAWALLALTDWLEASGGLEANYDYSLLLNGQILASGTASPGALFSAVELTTPIEELLADQPNQLAIGRGPGDGALYYTAHLTVYRPIEEVQATSRGLTVQHEYFHYDGLCGGVEDPCPPAPSAVVGEDLLARVTLIVPSEQYYLVVEDPYPAGMEPVDTQLLTTPTGGAPVNLAQADLLRGGWGGWWFTRVSFGDDRLELFADYLPAGTYQYTYLIRAVLPGEYRILPPRAWAVYFPEVYGQGAGRVYTIQP
ncbi:MAG TPA: hypothetical protein G4O11_05075 [Anaerolineae bacterium]|nr:hypothetical protein [Anaerolineae bacterium]